MNATTLPPEFISFWKHLCSRLRCAKVAHRHICYLWKSSTVVPGYYEDANRNASTLPTGWSYKNLLRYRPSAAELQIARRGKLTP